MELCLCRKGSGIMESVTEISLGSNITLSTLLECLETVSARCERKHTDPLQHSDDHDPPSAAHTASLIKMEGASTMSVSTGCEFKTISQTESGGGAFLSTNGNNNQILSIASSSFESVSSVGDGGVILAQLGAGSKLTVADTTFKLYSSSGKGGALSIVLSSTGSFAVEAGTSFESWSAIMSGSAVFVEAQSLASAITKTSSAGGHASRMEHSELVRRYSSCAVPG
ncbi:hypothetical protein BLNAU_9497 [Blattamonas nauphoetae]|uniref:Uncharacterized protein n=1 Tax=Blattamonas nauphoetae TaxID=2049346 RepID=A0ABQ9XVF2_9EUKA|nr:hypothetical protein BLNAU_9497 [Blattamonas nauphoetae]